MHDISYLPAYALQSAAQSVKALVFTDVGLKTIHKDAFFGAQTLEHIAMVEHKLTSPIYTMIPPSEKLRFLYIITNDSHDCYSRGSLDLNMLTLDKKKSLRMIEIVASTLRGL